jgi:hypothetical protein
LHRLPRPGNLSWALALVTLLGVCPALPAQNNNNTANRTSTGNQAVNATELEPGAINALKAMSEQLRTATSFSFTARIMREEPGTNGQMLDFFKTVHVQVQRPNKMRMEVRSDTTDVNVWCDGRTVTLMPVSGKIYTSLPAETNLDATLTMLKQKAQAHTPLIPFLRSDPYSTFSDGLESANEIGTVNDINEQYLHLAFTEADADWQLWLSGPNRILPRRMAIVYKKIEGQPRVTIEFSNWNLNAETPNDAFVFLKPAGAVAASWGALKPRTITQRGKQQ